MAFRTVISVILLLAMWSTCAYGDDGQAAFAQFVEAYREKTLTTPGAASLKARPGTFLSNQGIGPVAAGVSREELAQLLRAYIAGKYRDDAAWSLSRFIRYKTVRGAQPGGENTEFAEASRFLAELAARLKLRFKDMEGKFVEISLPGGEPPLGVIGHMDVVPADETGWKFPPFSGVIADGRVWGRGAQDDKGAVISAIYALAALRDAQVKMRNRVVLLVGTAEESSSDDVAGTRGPVMAA